MCSVSLSLGHFLQLGIGDEDVRGAVLAVVDEEVGLGALRQCVLARVRVRRPLRHRARLPLVSAAAAAAGIKRRGFQGQANVGEGGYLGGDNSAAAAAAAARPTAEESEREEEESSGGRRRALNRFSRSGVEVSDFVADHV